MPNNAASLPDDIKSLRRLVAAQRSELDAERAARMAAEGALLSRDLLIEKLKVQIARLKRMHFGRSSEKLATEIAQLELALEELETALAELPRLPASPIRQRKTPDRSLPAHLPREEIVHLPASGDCVCPACGGALRRLGEDADETLDIEPVVFKVVRHIRPKFSCRACETIVQAPAPEKAIARGKASFRMISHVIVSKFDHHLPLYRQAEIMATQGVDINRSTLAGWTGQGAALLDPIVARIRDAVLSSSKLHTDDTPVPMLDPGSGKTKTARLWVHAMDDRAYGGATKPAVWFAFTTDRRADHPKSILKDFRGHLQADAYPGIAAIGRGVATWTGTKPGAAGSPSSFALASRRHAKIKLGAIACFRAASGTFAPAPTSLQRSSSFLPETSGAAARHCAKSQAAVTSSRDLRSHAPPVLTGGLLHWKDCSPPE